jgi:hypothetical protein
MAPTPIEIVPAFFHREVYSAFAEHCGHCAWICTSAIVSHTGVFFC